MTKQYIQYINEIHKECWQESNEGEITADEIKKIIKKKAGATVVEKYWEGLHEFDRVEQVPDTQTWIVKKPEKEKIDIDTESNKVNKQVAIPRDIMEAGKQYGVNFSRVFTQAVIEEVSSIEQFTRDYLGEEFSEKEAEYIFELIKKGLHLKKGDRQKRAKRDKRRREVYKTVFNKEKADSKHIENLRQKSFELQELLEI